MNALDELRKTCREEFPTKLEAAILFYGDPQFFDVDEEPEDAIEAAKELAALRAELAESKAEIDRLVTIISKISYHAGCFSGALADLPDYVSSVIKSANAKIERLERERKSRSWFK